MDTITDVRELLDLPTAAAMSGLSVSGLRWLRAIGEGPDTVKIGKRVYVTREALAAWITSRAQHNNNNN